MRVADLVELPSLRLEVLWGEELLGREVCGVTETDATGPYWRIGDNELVLTRTSSWSDAGPGLTDSFVGALRDSSAAALLVTQDEKAGGGIPDDLLATCAAQGVPVLRVPARTSFRSVIEVVHRELTADLSCGPVRQHALPREVREQLTAKMEAGNRLGDVLADAFRVVGAREWHLLTSSGRTVAKQASAPALEPAEAHRAVRDRSYSTFSVDGAWTPYDAWYIYLPEGQGLERGVCHEIAELAALGRQLRESRSESGGAASRLVASLSKPDSTGVEREKHLADCDLPANGPYCVVVFAETQDRKTGLVIDALRETVRHIADGYAATGIVGEEAVAVISPRSGDAHETAEAIKELWPLLQACHRDLHITLLAGVSDIVHSGDELTSALTQARYATAVARFAGQGIPQVISSADVVTAEALLAGAPKHIGAIFSSHTLGPLLPSGNPGNRALLETLRAFFSHDCSWTRTAEDLELHVNTVRYRIKRIESLTGYDLSRMEDKLNLRMALHYRQIDPTEMEACADGSPSHSTQPRSASLTKNPRADEKVAPEPRWAY